MQYELYTPEKLLFYDIECFKHDSYVCFKDINKRVVWDFWNDGAEGFDGKAIHFVVAGFQLVGYNNYFYDDPMLLKMINGATQADLKRANDAIISNNGEMNNFRRKAEAHPLLFRSLDCMQQIDVSRPGLKKIEGNTGISIEETQIDFNIDRPLTAEERALTELYCQHDIDATIDIFKMRQVDYFDMKANLLRMYFDKTGEDPRRYPWHKRSTNTIAARVLLDKPLRNTGDPFKFNPLITRIWGTVEGIPFEVWDMWGESLKHRGKPGKVKNVKMKIFDCDIVFGFGGLHGVHSYYKEFTDVKLLDVASMYPNIIKLMGSLGNGSETYSNMIAERVAMKKTDPDGAAVRKLILNSVYGNLKNEFSWLFQPMESTGVCVYGQCALFDLCRELYEAGYQIININTDGVGFNDPDNVGDLYVDIWHAWESRWGLGLELDSFTWWQQKDVNNYVARTPSGKIKTKGGEVNKANNPAYFKNNDARIIQMALLAELTGQDKGYRVIADNTDKPELYQYVLQAGGTFAGTCDEDGRLYQKVNRVFPVREGLDSVKLYKMRPDGSRVNFPDMPDRMRVYNADLATLTDFADWVDLEHYRTILSKKLKQWG